MTKSDLDIISSSQSVNVAAIESAVLCWFATAYPELAKQLSKASVSSRELSPIGFFSKLDLPASVAIVSLPGNRFYDGCAVYASSLELFADCILHLKEGRADSLEIYAVGDGHPAEANLFEIREIVSNYVDLRDSDSL